MNVLIVGYGFVGKATYLLNNKNAQFYIYDIDPSLCQPPNLILEDIIHIIDIVFISVPTPLNIDGTCNTNIIDNILKKITHDYIIIRSTVNIGFCDTNNVFFMPEFLTEINWKEDFIENKYWIFGIPEHCEIDRKNIFIDRIDKLINSAYDNNKILNNNIIYCKNKEAELNKIVKNTFLSTKVSYFNEIYDLTQSLAINYDSVIEVLKLDERLGTTHFQCPGYNNKRGYGGTCFPKDTNSLYYQFAKNGIHSSILESNLFRNECIDRPEKDWLLDVNRTITKNNKPVCLITGGAGFIGNNLCRKLLNMDYFVICVDNLMTGNKNNILNMIENKNFTFINFDIRRKLFIPKIDIIFHLASITNSAKYDKYSEEIFTTNMIGIYNVLEICKTNKCKMIFSSIDEINYSLHDAMKNDMKFLYESKRSSETMIYEYIQKYNLNIKIVRFPKVYGPRMDIDDNHIFSNYINHMINNNIFHIDNNTTKILYIDDVVEYLTNIIDDNTTQRMINLDNSDKITTPTIGDIINLEIDTGTNLNTILKSRFLKTLESFNRKL